MSGAAAVAVGCPPDIRAKLISIRDSILSEKSGGRVPCARSREWAVLPVEVRMAYLLTAGIDGDLSALAVKSWREFTPPEREAIRAQVRAFAKAARSSIALVSRWGDD